MTDFISGIESELSKGYQRIDIPDYDNAPSSVVVTDQNVVQVVPPQLLSQQVVPQQVAQVPVVPLSQLYVPTQIDSQEVPRKSHGKMYRAKRAIRNVVNMAIIILVLLLIAVLIYLTFVRYYLAGANLMYGNKIVGAALLSPELSSGLSTLALAL